MKPTPLRKLYNVHFADKGFTYDAFKLAMSKEGAIEKLHSKLQLPGTSDDLKYLVGDELNRMPYMTKPFPSRGSSFSISNDGESFSFNDYLKYMETDELDEASSYLKDNEAGSSATGKYQIMWEVHGSTIESKYGIKGKEAFKNSPEIQEAYQKILNKGYEKDLPEIRELAQKNGFNLNNEELKYLLHHSGYKGAKRYLNREDKVPDKKGLEDRLRAGRKKGFFNQNLGDELEVNRDRDSKIDLAIKNLDAITVSPDVLPTRGNVTFKSKLDKNLVNKLKDVMHDNDLVMTDTNDHKIHKSREQNNGLSADINFRDNQRTIPASEIKKIIQDSSRKGLRLVYEVKDKATYNRILKEDPSLKDNLIHESRVTADHFSVYHDWNWDPDAQKLDYTVNNPGEISNATYIFKNKIYTRAEQIKNRLDKEDDENFNRRWKDKDSDFFTTDFNEHKKWWGKAVDWLGTKWNKVSDGNADQAYHMAAKELVENGEIDISQMNEASLAEMFNDTESNKYLEIAAKRSKERLESQLNDEGFLEGVGDWVARIIPRSADTFVSGIIRTLFTDVDALDGGGRLDTKDGKININSIDVISSGRGLQEQRIIDTNNISNPIYMDPKEIMELTVHPSAYKDRTVNPLDPNNPYNKELRRIQNIIANSDNLNFERATKVATKGFDLADARLKVLNKELENRLGASGLDRYKSLIEKSQSEQLTPEEIEEYQGLAATLQEGGLLNELTRYQEFAQNAYNTLEEAESKAGLAIKYDYLQKHYQELANRVDDVSGKTTNILRGLQDVVGNFVDMVAYAPESTTAMIQGTGLSLIGGSDGKRVQNVLSNVLMNQNTHIKPINPSYATGKLIDSRILDLKQGGKDYTVAYDKNGEIERIYDSKGYTVTDEELLKDITTESQRLLDKDYKGDVNNLPSSSIHWGSLVYGVKDNAAQLIGIFVAGGAFRKAGKALGASVLDDALETGAKKTFFKGLKSTVNKTLSKTIGSPRALESIGMIPVFSKDMMEQAIEDGAVTPGQVFGSGLVYLAVESISEKLSMGPIGKALAGKGVSSAAFNKTLRGKLREVAKHYATGKITAKDFVKYSTRVTRDLVKEAVGEGFEEAIIDITQGVVNKILNDILGTTHEQSFTGWDQVLSSFAIGMGAGFGMSSIRAGGMLVGSKKGIQGYYNDVLNDVIQGNIEAMVKNETVADPAAYERYLNEMVEAKELSRDHADILITSLNRAASDTKFTHDEETDVKKILGFIPRKERQNDNKLAFDSFVRNLAFNHYMTNLTETNNAATIAERAKEQTNYENVVSELEKNANKKIYSHAVPSSFATNKALRLTDDELTELRSRHQGILDKVDGLKLQDYHKAEALGILLHREAIKIKKETADEANKKALEEEEAKNKKAQDDLDAKNELDKDIDDINSGNFTDAQLNKVIKKAIDDIKSNWDSGVQLDMRYYRDLILNAPEAARAAIVNYILQGIEEHRRENFLKTLKDLSIEVSKASKFETKNEQTGEELTPEEIFNSRYEGDGLDGSETNTQLMERDWEKVKKSWLKQLDTDIAAFEKILDEGIEDENKRDAAEEFLAKRKIQREKLEKAGFENFAALFADPDMHEFKNHVIETLNKEEGTNYVKETPGKMGENIFTKEQLKDYTVDTIPATDVQEGDIIGVNLKDSNIVAKKVSEIVDTESNRYKKAPKPVGEIKFEDGTSMFNPKVNDQRAWEVTVYRPTKVDDATQEIPLTEAQEETLERIQSLIDETAKTTLEDTSDITVDEKGNIVKDTGSSESATTQQVADVEKRRNPLNKGLERIANILEGKKEIETEKQAVDILNEVHRFRKNHRRRGLATKEELALMDKLEQEAKDKFGLEIVPYIGKEYDERINIDVIEFEQKQDGEGDKKIIIAEERPQVNKNEVLTQRAQVRVLQGLSQKQYDAEIAALESKTTTPPTQEADIRRRWKEELDSIIPIETSFGGGQSFIKDDSITLNIEWKNKEQIEFLNKVFGQPEWEQGKEYPTYRARWNFKNIPNAKNIILDIQGVKVTTDTYKYAVVLENIDRLINAKYDAEIAKLNKQQSSQTQQQSDSKNIFELPSHYTRVVDGVKKLFRRVSNYIRPFNVEDKSLSAVENIFNAFAVGNYVDTFNRLFFPVNTNNILNEDGTEKDRAELQKFYDKFMEEIEKRDDAEQFKDIMPREEDGSYPKEFRELFHKVNTIKNAILSEEGNAGARFVTSEITLTHLMENDEKLKAKEGNKTYNHKWDGVAGTVDMIMVKADGSIAIYDFKSTKVRTKKSEDEILNTLAKDWDNGEHGIESNLNHYNAQQSSYAKMLAEKLGIEDPSKIKTNLIFIPVMYTIDTMDIPNRKNISYQEANKMKPPLEKIEKFKPKPSKLIFPFGSAFVFGLTYNTDYKNPDTSGYSRPKKISEGNSKYFNVEVKFKRTITIEPSIDDITETFIEDVSNNKEFKELPINKIIELESKSKDENKREKLVDNLKEIVEEVISGNSDINLREIIENELANRDNSNTKKDNCSGGVIFGGGRVIAQSGLAIGALAGGSKWQIVEEFDGPSHSSGGIDIKLTDNGFVFSNNKGPEMKAKRGLFIKAESND